ncbi:MAG: hypothetical protein ACLSGI_01535 [Butyricicoccaceae bacterium]
MGTMPLDPHLKSGAWRELTNDEIAYLQDIAADVRTGNTAQLCCGVYGNFVP